MKFAKVFVVAMLVASSFSAEARKLQDEDEDGDGEAPPPEGELPPPPEGELPPPAGEQPPPPPPPAGAPPTESSLKVELSEGEVIVRVEAEQGEQSSELKFKLIGGEEAATVELDFEKKTDPAAEEEEEVEEVVGMSVEVLRIIEFLPTDVAKGFQPEVDTVVSSFPPEEEWAWSPLVAGPEAATRDFTLTSEDGVFALKAYFTAAETANLSPDQTKLDVLIQNFPYAGQGTALAMETLVSSENTIEVGDTKTETTQAGDVPPVLLSWLATATADGATVPVISSTPPPAEGEEAPEAGGSQTLFFTFGTITPIASLSWDATLGTATAGSAGDPATPGQGNPTSPDAGEDGLTGAASGPLGALALALASTWAALA